MTKKWIIYACENRIGELDIENADDEKDAVLIWADIYLTAKLGDDK
jgi:hypothetical protein